MRERLTTSGTFFIKRILLMIYLAVFTIWMIGVVTAGIQGFHQAWYMAALAAPFMGLTIFLHWNLVRRYADQVELDGDRLIVRYRQVEERIALSNVMNVNVSDFSRPARIILRLRRPCAFGDEIRFFPRVGFHFNPFARNRTGELLIQHIDRARQKEFTP